MKMKSLVFSFIFYIFLCTPLFAQVLWEQDFNNCSDFSSGTDSIVGLATTHTQALDWNASSYRNPNSSEPIIKIGATSGRTGKGIEYRFLGTDGPMGGSIDITFSDPDIQWKTTIDTSGYNELYYAYWLKTPVDVDWVTGGSPPAPWKGARSYAYNNTTYSWSHFYNNNYNLSSHYFTETKDATTYKYSFMFPSWASIYMYWYPQYNGPADGHNGTSTYPHQPYNDTSTYLFDKYLDDNTWHHIEYHIKLNDVGSSNGLIDVYIDGVAINDGAAGLELRTDVNDKIMSIMLFDNYQKRSASGDQSLYIDDIVVSTTYIGKDYVIDGQGAAEIQPPLHVEAETVQ